MKEVLPILFSFLDVQSITTCLLLNKTLYKIVKDLFAKLKLQKIRNAQESVSLYSQFNTSKQSHIIATVCFEVLNNHEMFLKMNWKDFTKELIENIDKRILINKNDPFYNELKLYRNKLIILIIQKIDLYKYNIRELKSMLKMKNTKKYHTKNKDNLINILKENVN